MNNDRKPQSAEYGAGEEKGNQKQSRKTDPSTRKELVETLVYIAAAIAVFILIRSFLFAPVSVDGDSMVPTLHDHDRLILNKVSTVDRFDVIVFDAPDDPGKQYIKRVIGLPGDTVEVQDDQLYINGKEYSENYLDSSLYQLEAWENYTEDFSLSSLVDKQQVPADSYFVMGDNRLNSKDSRSFGFVKKEQVIGTAEFRIWPFDALGNIDKQEKKE